MKFCRFVIRNGSTSACVSPQYGLIEGEKVVQISGLPWVQWSRSSRSLPLSDVQFARSKGFDTFCAVGPHIETALNPSNVLVETHVNGARRQSGSTSLMAFPPAFLIRWISHMMTLMPGDLIATGTPAGVGPLVAGDTVEVSVAGDAVLRKPVRAPQAW